MTTTFVTAVDLASFLERDVTAAIRNIAERTNALVEEEWATPVTPVPQWVINLAWDVAIRAGVNPSGVTSTTRSWDDVTRTDRWEAGQRQGVYLTDAERQLLNNDGVVGGVDPTVAPKSIRMRVPGWSCPPDGSPCPY